MEYHYVYKLIHIETNEFYFGSRTSKIHPTLDSYLGSMRSWKPNKNKLKKIIIKDDFKNRENCINFERNLIIENINNKLNRNNHIPGINFHSVGLGVYINKKTNKIIRINSNDEMINLDDFIPFRKNKKHTEETKQKISNTLKNRKIDINTENKRRKRISQTLKGRLKSKEFRENLSKIRKGKKNPMFNKKGKYNHRSKPIYQFSLNNVFIKEWENGLICSKQLNLSYNGINNCLNGKTKTSGGFIWKYK